MRRLAIILALAVIPALAASAQSVSFKVSDGVSDPMLRNRIGENITALLSSFNEAWEREGNPDFKLVAIEKSEIEAVLMLWHNMPFHCDEAEIVEPVVASYSGWKVRNIPIELKPEAGPAAYQELVIDMNPDGTVFRINLALQNHLYRRVMSDGSEVSDLRHRQIILDYVEQFRTAYNRKDIDFLDKVFSDDALIITGKVIKRKPGDRAAILKETAEIQYTELKKREYIEKLRTKVFPAAKYIRVTFSDIRVAKHPSIDGYYGVMLRQGYESSNYSDDGYLFMIWDFRDEANPQIHVRTWQPYWLDDKKTQRLEEDKVFNINNFTIR